MLVITKTPYRMGNLTTTMVKDLSTLHHLL